MFLLLMLKFIVVMFGVNILLALGTSWLEVRKRRQQSADHAAMMARRVAEWKETRG